MIWCWLGLGREWYTIDMNRLDSFENILAREMHVGKGGQTSFQHLFALDDDSFFFIRYTSLYEPCLRIPSYSSRSAGLILSFTALASSSWAVVCLGFFFLLYIHVFTISEKRRKERRGEEQGVYDMSNGMEWH